MNTETSYIVASLVVLVVGLALLLAMSIRQVIDWRNAAKKAREGMLAFRSAYRKERIAHHRALAKLAEMEGRPKPPPPSVPVDPAPEWWNR